jgi:hypothetical protein
MRNLCDEYFIHLSTDHALSFTQTLNRERAVWARLNHPNIIPLYGHTQGGGIFGPYGSLISPVGCLELS